MDAVTGAPTVFVSLPQQSFNFTHIACEDGTTFNRTSGPGLGNITFDETNGQFFVSNFEDGVIYRLDQDGNILDSFDPQTLTGFRVDDGTAGFANDFMPYGLVVAPEGDRLYFGVHPVDNDPATPLDVCGRLLRRSRGGWRVYRYGTVPGQHRPRPDHQFFPPQRALTPSVPTRVGCRFPI